MTTRIAFAPLPSKAPLYHELFKLPKWNCRVSVASSRCPATASRLLKRQLSGWTQEQHLAQAQYHRERAAKLDRIWAAVWRRSFLQAFDRFPLFHDYHITAIGREEVAESHKRVLRHCAYTATTHKNLAAAHERAAGKRNRVVS